MNDRQNSTIKKDRLTRRQKTFLAALDKNLGNISDAAVKTGICRDMHYIWRKTNERYAQEENLIREKVLDFTESSLHKQIQDGNTAATIFKLKCLGKHRGYIERYEIESVTPLDLSKLTDDELCAYQSNKLSEQELRQLIAARLESGCGAGIEKTAISTITERVKEAV